MSDELPACPAMVDQVPLTDTDGTSEKTMELAVRLKAARLAAGYVYSKDAADDLGVPPSTYSNAENGVFPVSDTLRLLAISKFDVSAAFIETGEASDQGDDLARRIVNVLARAQGPESSAADPGELALRLKQMRASAGFRTAAAAARELGWVVGTYSSHESGQNPVTIERQIGYALGFGCRPEYAVLGEMPMRGEDIPWVDLRARGELSPAGDRHAWAWLHNPTTNGIPVVRFVDGRFRLLDERFSVPAVMLGTSELPWAAGSSYAVVENPSPDASIIYVVDVGATSGTMVSLNEGRIVLHLEDTISATPTDPLRRRAFVSPTFLGGLARKLMLRIDLD